MDISTLAIQSFQERLDEGCDRIDASHKFPYKLGFIDGFTEASIQWYPMEEAPKDGSHLLIVDENKYINHAYWFKIGPYDNQDFNWCVDQTYNEEILEYKIVKRPIAWTHLPVYKP